MAYVDYIKRFRQKHPAAPELTSDDPIAICEYIIENTQKDTRNQWLNELFDLNERNPRRPGIGLGSIALMVGGVLVAGLLAFGVFWDDSFLQSLSDPGVARGLVTFLFAFATISIFVITSIAIFWVKLEEVKERAGLAKELIAVMIGVLGTVLGFYFGSASDGPAPNAPAASQQQETQ